MSNNKKTNATKTNETVNEKFTTLANVLIDGALNGDGTKKSIVSMMLNNGFYTSTTATDTINYSDLYVQLNTTDKPRIWLRPQKKHNTVKFNIQYDKNAKRDNHTEFYESLGKKYGFKYNDTPSFANRNRTSDMISSDLLPSILSDLYNENILTTI